MRKARIMFWAVMLAGPLWIIGSCSTVPITGRSQLNLVPDSMMYSMSFDQYQQFIAENKVVTGTDDAAMVKRTGRRIQQAVEAYAAEHEIDLEGYDWEFNLVQDDAVNAWCMPGGKVVVYTGLLPVAQDESGLAVVMGHEIAHAIAKHGSERMSQGLLVEMGGMAMSQAVAKYPARTQTLFKQSYGVGAQVGVLLPYSRTHELEADHLGLIFMAMAGYDPANAVTFWQRMRESKGGGGGPELLSTHPADQRRIDQIRDLLPEAQEYYHPGGMN